ncbi:MAG TPA: GNAT family N-acetyltransferase [Candidatus Binatia bacterium]|nr:GNAT family N-acetyltransferase [Candidatus Binatia bacterium]
MPGLVIRPAEPRDVERAGDVNFVAFHRVALEHGVPPVVTMPSESRRYIRHLFEFDPLGGVVAEENDDLVGVGWLHPRGAVATIGPLAVDPRAWGRGIGRRLLERLVETAGKGVPQIRLVQESYNTVSLGLYLRSGFRVVAPLLELDLPAAVTAVAPRVPPGMTIRRGAIEDQARIVARDARAFGAPRAQSIELYLRRGTVLVAEAGGTAIGHAMGIGFEGMAFLGAASADDPETVVLLLAALAAELDAPGRTLRTLVPAADRRIVEALLALGFRVFRACLYMVRGGGTAPPANYVLMNGDMM